MKKLLAGMLFVLMGTLGMAATATAAEIPPTPECLVLNKELATNYEKAIKGKTSMKNQRRATREYLNQLVEADCLSDAAPLLKEMKAKPNTKQCAAAAAGAASYWDPYTKEFSKALTKNVRDSRPLWKQRARLSKRLYKLKAKNGSKQRIRSLKRSRASVKRKLARIDKSFEKSTKKILAPQADATLLILGELFALRCISSESLIDSFISETKKLDPVMKKLTPHFMVVLFSVLIQVEDSLGSNSGSASISSANLDLESLAGKSLPLPILNR